MNLLRNQSLSARLTRMNLLVSGAVLVIAALAFFSYDLFSFQHALIRNLEAEAQIVGQNSISALTFNDQESADVTLRSLEHSPDVQGAILTGSDGAAFAHFGRFDASIQNTHPLSGTDLNQVWSSGTQVIVRHRIVFQGKTVGTVMISARLTEIGQRVRQYALIAGIILIFCMAAALAISATSQKLIARPIIALSDTALRVSRDKDYSVRAGVDAQGSEIGVLVDAFNTMLAQIQERDWALGEARTKLEARVEERTSELRAANRELEAFSYTVAHDLRGPLDSIAGIAFLLAQAWHKDTEGRVQPLIDQLSSSTAHMTSLIDDLLNFARASTVALKSVPVNLSQIAQEIAEELKASEPGRNVEFKILQVQEVPADAGLIRIVLGNLLRNSWKYSSRHAHACIEFGSTQENGTTVYFVRDDGAGFDPANMGKLFEPFERLHGKNEFLGTGIGLATVKRILTRQGGTIWAEGAVEKGATFYFTLSNDV